MTQTNETTAFIIDYFLRRGIYARRHSVAAGKATYTNKAGDSKDRFFKAGMTGGLDILVWLPNGPHLSIDVKTGKDRLRPEQEGFISSVRKMGHLAMTVKDPEDFLQKIEPILNSLPHAIS